jgi:hypothetical protein
MASYAEAVFVNHVVLCVDNGCGSCCIMLSKSMGITV